MHMYHTFNEFKRCLKPIYIEEIFDLGIFRPLAFLLVKVIYPLPITPNHITITGMLAALAGGAALAQGTRLGFALGGVCFLIAVVLDCADGMLARLKGNGTKVGRILDGLFDYVAMSTVLTGMAIGLNRVHAALPLNIWLLLALAALSTLLQSITVDYAKNQFVAYGLAMGQPITDEIEEFEQEHKRLRRIKSNPIEMTLIRIYIAYSKVQARSKKSIQTIYDQQDYFQKNLLPVRLWTLIGPGTHRFVFVLAALLYQPLLYFGFVIVIGNLWMITLLLLQALIKPNLKRTGKTSAQQVQATVTTGAGD